MACERNLGPVPEFEGQSLQQRQRRSGRLGQASTLPVGGLLALGAHAAAQASRQHRVAAIRPHTQAVSLQEAYETDGGEAAPGRGSPEQAQRPVAPVASTPPPVIPMAVPETLPVALATNPLAAPLTLVKTCGNLPQPPPGLRRISISVDFTLA